MVDERLSTCIDYSAVNQLEQMIAEEYESMENQDVVNHIGPRNSILMPFLKTKVNGGTDIKDNHL